MREPVAAPERKPPLPGLTGIRTFLALGIMCFHFTPPHATYIRPVIEAGFTYISFFLLISGFVLAYNYAHRADTLRPGRFYAARAARLYPVYALSLIVSLGMLHAEWQVRSHAEFALGAVLTPLLLQGWSPSLSTFWNTVAWTLSTEVMLYLAFPFLIRAKWWPTAPRKLLLLFFGFWLWELLIPVLYLLFNPDGLHNIDRYSSAYWLRALKYTPLPYLPIFLAGITLGRFHAVAEIGNRTKMYLAAGALTMLLPAFYFAVPHLPYVLLHGGLLTPVFAMLVLGLTGTHWVTRVFSIAPIAAFGRASLCLYLLHFNTWNLLHEHFIPQRLHVEAYDPWFSYAVMLTFAYAAYHLVEVPAQRFLLTRYVYIAPTPTETMPTLG